MTKAATEIFGLRDVSEYLLVTEEAVAAFGEDRTSLWKCFAALLLLNHLPDWLDGKLTETQRAALGWASNDRTPAKDHFAVNSDVTLVRSVANGIKHLSIKHPTQDISGYGMGAYGIGPYGKPYLVIDLGEDRAPAERWIVADDLAKRLAQWWRQRLMTALGLNSG